MNEHVVVLRLERDRHERPAHAAAATTLATQSGVRSVAYDAGAATLLVWYQRAAISLGDLVRLVEDHGARVTGVAQSRARDAVGVVGA